MSNPVCVNAFRQAQNVKVELVIKEPQNRKISNPVCVNAFRQAQNVKVELVNLARTNAPRVLN